jgi:hypothetical protein
MKLLVVKITHFASPKGDFDDGEVEKFVTDDETYLEFKANTYYSDEDDPESEVEEDDIEGSPDGYNDTYYSFEVKKISEEQAKKYKEIIKAYNKL